jgi:hypothetical protein
METLLFKITWKEGRESYTYSVFILYVRR